MIDGDVGKTLGRLLHYELGLPRKLVSIDGVQLKELDFVDIGELIDPPGVVPVVIKSLLFSYDRQARTQLDRRAQTCSSTRQPATASTPISTGWRRKACRSPRISASTCSRSRPPWARYGCNAAAVHLKGRGDFGNMFVYDIAPGKSTSPQRHLYEEVIYVLEGTG